MATPAPSAGDLASRLGAALGVWEAVVAALAERYHPLEQEWKPSKSDFGRMCLLRNGTRTLLYLTPEKDAVVVAVVLGERAVRLGLEGDLPGPIKALLREARPYAEGRGIRFPIRSMDDVPVVTALVAARTARA